MRKYSEKIAEMLKAGVKPKARKRKAAKKR
jgi:hypothetical protein